ncbi:MAG: hypothetical protein ACR2NR_14725 [Solirubrobacteraceae bacterium]
MADASAALGRAHGFTAQGSIIEGSRRTELTLIDASPSPVDLSFTLGRTMAQLVRARGGSYFRANRVFWTAHAGARAANLADRWIEIPLTSSRSFTASLGSLAPATLARCLGEDHGTLSIAGKITIEHRRAILVKDAGDAPGSSPGVLAVAATGTPYPLAYTATGGQRAGGRIDFCNQGKADTTRGTITFDNFGRVPPVTPPANPLRLAQPPSI